MESRVTPISVCIPTYNSERTIRETLKSVAPVADEIIVVDSFSTDGTLEIVREFTDKIYQNPYTYHGVQMNYAIERCQNDWVFCIDSDERMDEPMQDFIEGLKEGGGLDGAEAFRLRREWYFLGKPVHALYPISSPDRIVRLFDRRVSRFNDRPVHDKPVGHTRVQWLEGRLIHDTMPTLHELFDKMNKYTTRHARGFSHEAQRVTLLNVLFNPPFAFLKWYFLKKNFLDGFRGLVLGASAGMYTFLKYSKLYQMKPGTKSGAAGEDPPA